MARRLFPRRLRASVSKLAWLCLIVSNRAQSIAAEPSADPILRVETGMHTTLIRA
jgi:hypothetical protein